MGQLLSLLAQQEQDVNVSSTAVMSFNDLRQLPPELALMILSKLNATDLCLAACVWREIADSEFLWANLCHKTWRYISAYSAMSKLAISFKRLYMILDDATVTFNVDPQKGLNMLILSGLLADSPREIARFIYSTDLLRSDSRRRYLKTRPDVLDEIIKLENFEDEFLPNALRHFFSLCGPPNERDDYLSTLIDRFADRFLSCNPDVRLNKDAVYILCFSLILLSVDLHSPHVRNKMSKREFIRNTRQAIRGIDEDFIGHLYDNIWLSGHVASVSLPSPQHRR